MRALFTCNPGSGMFHPLDFAPGAQTPLHTHPGQVVSTLIDGGLTFTTGGATKVYKTGESFVELPGVVGQARNAGSAPAAVMAVLLRPKGAPLSVPVAPAPPATGIGGTLPGLPSTGAGGGTISPVVPAPLGLAALGIGALVASVALSYSGAARRGELTRPVPGFVPRGQPVAPAPGSWA